MIWAIVGKIADILGILSFLLSLGILKKIHTHSEMQKNTYINERDELLSYLSALQKNIWMDGLISAKLQDQLESKLLEYRMKYWLISSFYCHIRIHKALRLLKKEIRPNSSTQLRHHINYLIARLNKKE